ncbi:MAG TPA: hypothetical protein VGS57_22495 [Thermoanaerobaculia bacterium]|jgi:hypothetical protein|nr:hypothetical protein [Thermoanaerobaculia bacterium]
MARGQLVAVSQERLQEIQQDIQKHKLAAAQAGSPLPREVPSLPNLRARLARGRDLIRKPLEEDELLPTALPAVDPLLAGGLARACLTELRGALSSGRFGLVLSLLAATTARGEAAALIDLGDQLDPQEAARCGVVLPRLLWARPQRLREALAAAEIALGGDFPLVVLELGTAPLPYGSRDEHAWLRLARAARLHRAALLVATPWRITGSAAGEVLALSRRGGVWIGSDAGPRLLAGMETRLEREKSRRQEELAGSSPHADLGLRAPSLLGPLPARERGRGAQLLPETLRLRQPKRAPAPRPLPAWPRPTKVAALQQSLLPPDALPAYAARTSVARVAATAASTASPTDSRPFASRL